MNLVENFMVSVDRDLFLKCNQGDEMGKIQMLSGFGNKCKKNATVTIVTNLVINET
jgi:hypothetical protein